MKATERHFPVVLIVMLCKVILTFATVNEISKWAHSNERADKYFPVILFITLYKVSLIAASVYENPGPGYFSITFTSIAHGHVNEWVITFLTWRVYGSKTLTYFNHHFRPSPTSLYSESVSFEHLKEIRTLCYKITNFKRSLAGMFSTSPQFSGKNFSKVKRLISKTANSVFFCTFFTYMNTMCTRAQKWAPGSSVHTILESCGQSTALFSLISSCFKMESDRAKWTNYVHSHISGTQSVNTTPLCAGS